MNAYKKALLSEGLLANFVRNQHFARKKGCLSSPSREDLSRDRRQ